MNCAKPGGLVVCLILLACASACVDPPAPTRALVQAAGGGDGARDGASVVDGKAAADTSRDGSPSACQGIPELGCCDGQTLYWCSKSGALRQKQCSGSLYCGWNTQGFHDCNTSGSSEPTGKIPKGCAAYLGDGGTPLPRTDTGADGALAACAGITAVGCCDGRLLKFCDKGVLRVIDCTINYACGWRESPGYYDCGNEGKTDPKGLSPKECPVPSGRKDTGADLVPYDYKIDTLGPGAEAGGKGGGDCTCGVGLRTNQPAAFGMLFWGLIAGVLLVARRPRRR